MKVINNNVVDNNDTTTYSVNYGNEIWPHDYSSAVYVTINSWKEFEELIKKSIK